MTPGTDTASSSPGHDAHFTATHWSVVAKVGDEDPAVRAAALEQLCRAYWYPIYSFIRRSRHCSHEEAEDLAQGFFAQLVEAETVKRADREKGRFRTFLLGALEKFLVNDWKRQHRIKRGGRSQTISIDEAVAEGLYGCEPVEREPSDTAFDRRWAATLLRRVLDRLRKEYVEAGTTDLFEELESSLLGKGAERSHAETAAKLGKSEAAVRVAVHRLRVEFRRVLRQEVADTVSSGEEIDDEIRHLIRAASI
jgi:RNA polymerase sigma-70 factor (ECF subfamily)